MTSIEKRLQVAFDPEYILNLGERAAALTFNPNVQTERPIVQDMRWILYRGLYRMLSEKPFSVRPETLGWSDGLSEAVLVQGRRVAGVLGKEPRRPESQETFGPAFMSLKSHLQGRLGDLPDGINDELAFNGVLLDGYATTAKSTKALSLLTALDLEVVRQGILLEADHLVERNTPSEQN
jgi:hypothetical protein